MGGNGRETGDARRSLAAYARLVRLPNLFTAPPDVVLGGAIAAAAGGAVGGAGGTETVAGLAVASVLLYAAGTTLNDYFDASEDARHRPERPIPAGDVSRSRALALGAGLLVAGVAVALIVAGPVAGIVAGALALSILLYDGVFKGSAVGFLFMGASRGLNVTLGATAVAALTDLPARAFAVPAVVLLYVAGVTFMAESETGESSSAAVGVAIAGTTLAALYGLVLLVARSPGAIETVVSGLLLVGFVAWTGRALWTAYTDPAPETVGPAVGTCVLGLVVLDAAFAAATGVGWALVALSFLVPAVGLARTFDVS